MTKAIAEIRERGRRRQAAGDDRPPEHQPGRDQHRVLDVQRPAGAQRPVVEAGRVRPVPGDEPRGQRVPRADVARAATVQPALHRRRQTEQDQQRRDVRDQRVLQQVDEQEVVLGDRLERRVERCREQEQPDAERRRSPARRPVVARGADVHDGGRGDENEEDRLEREARRAHARDGSRRGAPTRRQRGRSRSVTQIPSMSSCSTIITTPDELLIGERARARTRPGTPGRAGGTRRRARR